MSTPDSRDSKRILYIEQIDIEANNRTKLNFRLQQDDHVVEIRRKEGTSSWIPSRTLEILDGSNIAIDAKSKFNLFGKYESLAKVSGEDAMKAFWNSQGSLSCPTTFDRQPLTITLHFRPSHMLQTIRTAVENLQGAMKDYKSLMKESTAGHIDTVVKIGAALAEMNPFAKLAFGLAKGTFDLLKEQRKYDENISDLADGIDGILPFAERALESVLYEEELLDRVIRRLYDLIGQTAVFVIDYAKRGPAIRALRLSISSKDRGKIAILHRDFGKLKEEFDRAVDVAVLTLARRNEELRLLERLRPVDTNYEEGHSCMEGTRTTVLDNIFDWAAKPGDGKTQPGGSNPSMFWLYGMPGLGKTSVANSLSYRLCRSGHLGGVFFCKHDNPDLREPKRVLPTLIAKLVQMWGPFRKLVAEALINRPQINPESIRGELLLEPLRLLKTHPIRPLVLVIDALDECGQPSSREPLLNCLTEACSLVHWLKIVITSRPEHDIESFFDENNVERHDLAAEDPKGEDIRLFTETRMAAVARHRKRAHDWPGPERVSRIVELSGGLFMFVDTLSRLVDAPEPEPILAQVLSGSSEGANNPLHDLYSMAIKSRISKPTQAFHSILRAIIAVSANRPLCDKTLAELLSLELQVVREWVDELGSFLYRDDSEKGGIRVRHLSILEFLVGPNCPTEFQIDLKLANSELAVCCLKNMERQLKFNICELETSYLPNSEIQDLNDRVEQRIPDTLQYSCVHWSNHLCYNMDQVDKKITRLLDDFFAESRFLCWLEVLSLKGKLRAGVLALQLMKACNKKFENHHQHAMEDALRFVLAFFAPISTSTSHIYISALAFMPTESSIWKCANLIFPRILNVCEGRMKYWPAPSGICRGHSRDVTSVAYSPDGRNVVSGSRDYTIRIWDAYTGAAAGKPLKGHTGSVLSIAYSPDGHNIVSGSYDNTIRIWDAQTGATVGEPLRGHTGWICSVAYSPDGRNVISGSEDKMIRIWDAQTGAPVGEPLKGHTELVWSVAYSPDGRSIVSGSSDCTIRTWDTQTGATVGKPLVEHTSRIYSVAYSPDGRNVVSGSGDNTLRIWDAHTGAAEGEPLEGHSGNVFSVAYSSDGRNVISGSGDNTIRIWDASTRTTVGEPLNGHLGCVMSVAYSPDGLNIVSGAKDNTIRIWDAQRRTALGKPLEGHAGKVWNVAYSPDGRKVVSGSSDKTIRIWDAQTGAAVGEPIEGHTGTVWSVAYSPDGRNVVSGSYDKTIRIWDVQTYAAVCEPLEGHTGWVMSVAYSPDGQNVVSGARDSTIRIWDAQTGAADGEPLEGHTGIVWSVAYSPDGHSIVSGSEDKTFRIWDAQTGAAVGTPFKGHNGTVWSVAYSPDGRKVVSGSGDNTIRIWDAYTGAAVGEPLEGHKDSVISVAYSLDGCNVVSGSSDNTIRIWDTQTGAMVGEPLEGHTGGVRSVAYSPDGRNVVSGARDNTIRIWDARTDTERDARGPVCDSAYPSGHRPLNAYSRRSIPKNWLSSDGWVRSTEGLLFWVPEDCRNGLTNPAIITIPTMGDKRRVRIDFTHFECGTSWTNVRGRSPEC